MADEGQALDMAAVVDPVVAFCAHRDRQQVLALVVADGLGLRAGGLGKFADFPEASFAKSALRKTKQRHLARRLTLRSLQGFQLGHEIRNQHSSQR